ncbi:hypothetical protein [Streptomyces kronopolitis]|uniref:hypothetical protein n=1 Tax=Streptomyces kronopolitis TaxID=1612435 RepID=UPI0020C0716A|nr:hypothetical protein [Streptomyces kronopolitis]MCL6302843.1 hypothetical protein [Streptomyces kronopolitis]
MTRTRSNRRARTARRDSLLVLLSRAEYGVLSPVEAALLRTTVEAELVEGDTARRAAGGQQAAVRRMQQRIDAAEQAIVETEQHASRCEATLAGIRAARTWADVWAHLGMFYGLAPEQAGQEARARRTEAERRAEEQRAEREEHALRYANYLAAAQRACGAPDWPSLADHIAARLRTPEPAPAKNAA